MRFIKKRALIILFAVGFFVPALKAQEQFSRDLEQIAFVPKGQWLAGVSVNYSQSSQDNYQFLVV